MWVQMSGDSTEDRISPNPIAPATEARGPGGSADGGGGTVEGNRRAQVDGRRRFLEFFVTTLGGSP